MAEQEMSKTEIEQALQGKGDFVKIDYLQKFLSKAKSLEMRKFILLKTSEIYEDKGMLNEAARMCDSASHISIKDFEKVSLHMRESGLYIKSGYFEHADLAFKKALSFASQREKDEIKKSLKEFYFKQGEAFEKSQRRSNAIKLYEKMQTIGLDEVEKARIRERLIDLYEKTGRLKDYFAMKGKIN